MENIKKIMIYVKRHLLSLLLGVFFLFCFAVFNGLNVTAIKPVLDFIFVDTGTPVKYYNYHEFIDAITETFKTFYDNNNIWSSLIHLENFKPFISSVNDIMKATDSKFLLYFITIFVAILYIVKNIVFYLQKAFFINFRGLIVRDIRNDLFSKYVNQSLAFFTNNHVGDAMVRLVNDVAIINDNLIMASIDVFRQLVTILLLVRIAVFLNPKLFLYSLILLPIVSLLVGVLGKKIKKYAKKIQSQFSNLFSNVEEVFNNIKIVKAFAKEDYEIKKFRKINNKYFKNYRKADLYNALNFPIGEINSVFTGLLILLIGGTQILDKTSTYTFGDFMAFLLVVFSIMHPLKVLSKAYSNLKRAEVSLSRVYEILNRNNQIKNIENPIIKDEFKSDILFKNVSFSYNNKENVINNIYFKIKKGMSVALVGSSGSGKTTIVNLLTRMYDVTAGEIFIDGENIRNIKISALRRLFGTVTQDSFLFSNTIRNNIEYGKKGNNNLDIKETLKISYSDEFVDKLPQKLDQPLLSKGTNISGGQKQRICIARAIISNPPIIIFDEATSALDTESEQKVQKAIEEATKDRTVITIAHRLSTILNADMIIVLEKGSIVAVGKHTDLLKNSKRYKELYDIQFNSHILN